MPNPKFEYLSKQDQFRNKETGRFVSANDVVREGEIQVTENNRFKLRGGSFISQKSVKKRQKEEKPYEKVEIGERLVTSDDEGNIEQIRIYSPSKDQTERAIVQQGIKKGVISEGEYLEFDGNTAKAADLVRERAIIRQHVI